MRYTEKSRQAGNYQPHSNFKYGVYALRAQYHITVIKSLLLVCAMIAATALLTRAVTANRKLPEIKSGNFEDVIYTISVDIPVEKPEAPAVPESPVSDPPPSNTSGAGAIRVVDTENQMESTVTFSPSSENTGNPDNTGTGSTQTLTGSGITGFVPGASTTVAEPHMVDKMPEFEGGINALYKFISSHIRYPEEARDLNKGGTVGIQFIVDTDGNISEITFLNKVGYGMDEEAKRVIGLLPRFKSPGMANGAPVRVYYKLPIKFRIE